LEKLTTSNSKGKVGPCLWVKKQKPGAVRRAKLELCGLDGFSQPDSADNHNLQLFFNMVNALIKG
jgi:hypothetical protein